MIKKYVEMGIGISIVTDICLEEDDRIATIPVREYFPSRSYGIVIRRGKFIPAQAKRFIEMLAPEFFHRPSASTQTLNNNQTEPLASEKA